MSIKVSTYVWKHSKHRGTVKMLLLAMAEFANDSGVCWPSAATLADRINETERNTRQIIKGLVESGDLLTVPGGGRGNTTHYAIAVGMNAHQKTKLKGVLDNTVSNNSEIKKTVKSGDLNSDIPRQETVKSGDLFEGQFEAPESAEPAKKSGGIRHIDPSLGPKVDSIPNQTHDPSAQKAPGDHKRLMQMYSEALPDHRIPNGGREAKAAKEILAAGYTPEQAIQAYQILKQRDIFAAQHLSLSTVNTHIGAVLSARKNGANRNGTAHRASSKGHSVSSAERTISREADLDRDF